MKNRNLAKVLVLVLSLALLIGSLAAVSVSAETEEIAGVSIVHGAKIQIAIAADADATVTYKWGAEGETLTATKGDVIVSDNAAVNGKTAYLTEGVAYYELSKVAYINVNGEEITYSVAQFLFAQIYRDKVGGNAQACYEALLALGDASQVHLNQNASALPSNSTYAYTNDANITINGDNFAFAPSGEATAITLAYTGSEEYTGYKAGALIFSKAKAEAGNAIIDGVCEVSLYTDPIPEYNYDFQSTVTSGIDFYNFTGQTTKVVEVHQTTIGTTTTASSYYGTIGKLVADPTDSSNQVLSVVVNGATNNSNTTNGGKNSTIKFTPMDRTANGKVHVVEYDLYVDHINKAAFADPFEMFAYDADGNQVASLQNNSSTAKYCGFIYYDVATTGDPADTTNNYHFGNGEARSGGSEASTVAVFDAQKWYRFRMTWDEANGKMYFDVSFDKGTTWYAAFIGDRNVTAPTGEVASLGFQFNIYGVGYSCMFDNISYKIVDAVPANLGIGNDAAEGVN